MGTLIGMGIEKPADKKEDKIKELSAIIEKLDKEINGLYEIIEKKDKEIDTLSKTIEKKDKEIDALSKTETESLNSSEGGTEDGTNTENGNGSAGKSNTKKTK